MAEKIVISSFANSIVFDTECFEKNWTDLIIVAIEYSITQNIDAVENIPIKKKFFGIIKATGINIEYINMIKTLYLNCEHFIPANENYDTIVSQPIIK